MTSDVPAYALRMPEGKLLRRATGRVIDDAKMRHSSLRAKRIYVYAFV